MRNIHKDFRVLAVASILQSITIFILLGVTFCGCAHTGSIESEVDRQIAAARTASVLFGLALAEAERACASQSPPADRESPCNGLHEAREALDKLEQAIVLADANRGMLASALTGIEQLAEVVDAARR